MMFSAKFISVAVAALAVPALAVPATNGGAGQCNTGGGVQCCNSVQPASSQAVQQAIAGLGVAAAVLGPITGQVGLTCTPVSVLALSGNSCTSQPVCCQNNHFNGAVNIGCTPVNVAL